MKKIALFLCFILVTSLFVACVSKESPADDINMDQAQLDRVILLKDTGRVKKNEASAERQMTVSILGTDYELKYDSSTFVPLLSDTIRKYTVASDNSKTVEFDGKGNIVSLNFGFARLEIDKHESSPSVYQKLIDVLSGQFDPSGYTNLKTSASKTAESDGFGQYNYFFYNELGGYTADSMNVAVKDDGTVSVTFAGVAAGDETAEIDDNIADLLLYHVLCKTYEKDGKKLFVPQRDANLQQLVRYNGELGLMIGCTANFTSGSSGSTSGTYAETVFIPLDVVIKK